MNTFSLLIVCFLGLVCAAQANVGCLSETGAAVDWFVFLKIKGSKDYAYADSRSPTLKMSSNTLDDPSTGAISLTLSQVYGSSAPAHSYAFWNDEKPDGKTSTSRGHTKGVLGMDDEYGFWLVHSIPLWPAFGSSYEGLQDSGKYGQSGVCFTVSVNTMDQIGLLLQEYNPFYYDNNIDSSIESKVPNLITSLNGDHSTSTDYKLVQFKTKAGMAVDGFGKPAQCEKDISNEIISPYYKQNTWSESWMNGINPLDSFCKPTYEYDTLNIRMMNYFGFEQTETTDHSKWTLVEGTNYVCMGGLNRQASQQKRYGGFTCFEQKDVYHSIADSIDTMDSCAAVRAEAAERAAAGSTPVYTTE